PAACPSWRSRQPRQRLPRRHRAGSRGARCLLWSSWWFSCCHPPLFEIEGLTLDREECSRSARGVLVEIGIARALDRLAQRFEPGGKVTLEQLPLRVDGGEARIVRGDQQRHRLAEGSEMMFGL